MPLKTTRSLGAERRNKKTKISVSPVQETRFYQHTKSSFEVDSFLNPADDSVERQEVSREPVGYACIWDYWTENKHCPLVFCLAVCGTLFYKHRKRTEERNGIPGERGGIFKREVHSAFLYSFTWHPHHEVLSLNGTRKCNFVRLKYFLLSLRIIFLSSLTAVWDAEMYVDLG